MIEGSNDQIVVENSRGPVTTKKDSGSWVPEKIESLLDEYKEIVA